MKQAMKATLRMAVSLALAPLVLMAQQTSSESAVVDLGEVISRVSVNNVVAPVLVTDRDGNVVDGGGDGQITALQIYRQIHRARPDARVVIRPSKVQGEGAATDLIRALTAIVRVPEIDVVIIGRGGGSVEDLWAFNEEPVARAIHARQAGHRC